MRACLVVSLDTPRTPRTSILPVSRVVGILSGGRSMGIGAGQAAVSCLQDPSALTQMGQPLDIPTSPKMDVYISRRLVRSRHIDV